jgi:hypothetical protein
MNARDAAVVAEARLVTLWAAYVAAAKKAQASNRIDDGIMAGHAWAAWLEAFLPPAGEGAK